MCNAIVSFVIHVPLVGSTAGLLLISFLGYEEYPEEGSRHSAKLALLFS